MFQKLLLFLAIISPIISFPHAERIFTTPETCAECHGVFYTNWSQSMHSNAAKDPYFLAKLSNEVVVVGSFVEEECAKCHTPTAKLEAKLNRIEAIILRSGFLNKSNELYEFAIDGVSCTLCHQIKKNNFSGNYLIDINYKKPERAIYGPFIPMYSIEMYRNSGYFPTRSENFLKSDLCGNCHVVYTPTIEDGKITKFFAEQTTFLEWKNSIYNPDRPCQSCHMKEESFRISTKPENIFERKAKHHHFSGANVQILKILGDEIGAKRSEAQLKSSAEIKIISVKLKDGEIEILVEIKNNAGHKFPTGFPSRRAIVHVLVEDPEGIIFESGRVMENGKVIGENYPERHYDLITSEDQVQIYESVMMGKDGEYTIDLTKAHGYIKDNRILPKGFTTTLAHPDTIPVGVEDDNFSPGKDRITYLIKKEFKKPLKIRAELLYQPISWPFIEGLENTAEVKEFIKMLENIELTTLISSDEITIN
jgi:hypothetical protein